MKVQFSVRNLILSVILISITFASIGAVVVAFQPANPVVQIRSEEIKSVALKTGGSKGRTFDVPVGKWSELLLNFSSTRTRWFILKWQIIAVLTFSLDNGEEITVRVFETESKPGCFQVGASNYAGGDEDLILRLIEELEAKNGLD